MLILGNYIRSLRLLLILHRLVLTLAENIEDQLILYDKLKGDLEKMINKLGLSWAKLSQSWVLAGSK